jgi:hypothetical protein
MKRNRFLKIPVFLQKTVEKYVSDLAGAIQCQLKEKVKISWLIEWQRRTQMFTILHNLLFLFKVLMRTID